MQILTPYSGKFQRILCAVNFACLLGLSQITWAAPGSIQLVIGTARISKHFGQDRPALKGDAIYEGDTIATSANSNVQIRMIDGAVIWVRPESRLKIEKYKSDKHGATKSEAALLLISGSMREVTGSIGKTASADFKLSTPNATIGIRGTEFDAMYATPQIAAQLNPPAGTYNRVYEGSTSLEGASGRINLNKDQAGFMGLQTSDTPRVLPTIPSFLNTTLSGAPAGSSGPSALPKTLQISVRYGELSSGTTTTTRSNSSEQRVQTSEGVRASLALPAGPAGERPAEQTSLELIAKVNGSTASVQFFTQNQSVNSSGSQDGRGSTILSVPLGSWTEVSGRGPWSDSGNNVTTSRSVRPNKGRVFLKVDEVVR